MERDFASRLATYVRDWHGESVIRFGKELMLVKLVPKQTLHRLVFEGIQHSKKHGFQSEAAQSGFIILMFEIAPNFDEDPAARQILSDSSVPQEDRVRQLAERLTTSDWARMNRAYDPEAWRERQR